MFTSHQLVLLEQIIKSNFLIQSNMTKLLLHYIKFAQQNDIDSPINQNPLL